MAPYALTLSDFTVLGGLTTATIVASALLRYYSRTSLPVPPGPKGKHSCFVLWNYVAE